MKWLVLVCAFAGCTKTNSVTCSDGRVCPSDKVCDDTHQFCVTEEQSTVCVGKPDGDECTAGALEGHCLDGICLPSVCGDGVAEFGEMCDDRNTFEEDMCSADCTSTRVCMNNVVDPDLGEQCDDGNHLDHDGCASNCLLETPRWFERTLPPAARTSAAYAYDSRRGRLVVFGGSVGSAPSGTTIEWNGADWTRVDTPQGPPPRYAASMTYDSDRGEVVLFGGFDGTNDLVDTWVYDGATWTLKNVGGPKERYGAMFVHDPKRHVSVLFGGFNDYSQQIKDTWEWDGTKWTEVTTGPVPPERESPVAAYDPKAGVIVMTGGYRSNVNGSGNLPDTWTFDGQWHYLTVGPQPQMRGATMAWDPVGQRILLYGGANTAYQMQQNLWAWNGSTWTNLGAGLPPARVNAAMANTGSQIVLFGGSASGGAKLDDTWTFTATWSQVLSPGSRRMMTGVNDVLDARAVYYGGLNPSSFQAMGDTWGLSASGYQQLATSPPNARYRHVMAWDPARRNAVVFGGYNGGVVGDTWVGAFDTTGMNWEWTQRTPSTSPGPLQDAAMGFDGTRVILFGGMRADLTTRSDETWTWDGVSWSQLTIAGPTARTGAAMGYDPIRKNLVLFGGYCADPDVGVTVSCNDTWIFDGQSWQRAMTPFRPERRDGATLTWNPSRQRLILVGGSVSALNSFEWDGTQWLPIPAINVPFGRGEHATVTSIDGAGILVTNGSSAGTSTAHIERWELRWDATALQERCDATDADQDKLVGCADPDCWPICAPLCPPGVTCDATASPRCGDGACQKPRESCRTCATDCNACPLVCGDYVCDPGETSCPGDCP